MACFLHLAIYIACVGLIYFIAEDKPGGAVKIGYTSHGSPANRLRDLQIGNPNQLCILASIEEVERAYEARIHYECAAQYIRGEWFRNEGRVAEYIAAGRLLSPPPCIKSRVEPGKLLAENI